MTEREAFQRVHRFLVRSRWGHQRNGTSLTPVVLTWRDAEQAVNERVGKLRLQEEKALDRQTTP